MIGTTTRTTKSKIKAGGEMARYVELRQRRLQLATPTKLCLIVLFFGCIASISRPAYAQIALPSSGDIDTVAGNQSPTYAGDGGAATSASIRFPQGVAVDTHGNVYIADTGNNRIRMVTASTGDISTVAGNGTNGFSGDSGAATSAELSSPQGVAVDSSGNIYIADTSNYRIRMVAAATGDISTVAGDGTAGYTGDGGAATSAELDAPIFLAVDGAGNIYVTDTSSTRVRMVTVSTGDISTVAGDGGTGVCVGATDRLGDGCTATDAELDSPEGVAVDASGNIYIADSGYCEIRKVTALTGVIASVAGDTTCGFSGDSGSATSAEINGPFGVAVDSSGNIYIADNGNNRIRKVTAATGYISTVAGSGSGGYSGDGGAATSAGLNNPESLAVDGSDNIYLVDEPDYIIRAVAP
jgi:trimeric autotransporter adhesin